jgi:hypothetical protein
MQNSAMGKDEFFINIIQKTPHVEDLAKSINSVNIDRIKNGEQRFPSIDEVSILCTWNALAIFNAGKPITFMTFQGKVGTRYQKCRRLYDNLHTEFFTYDLRKTQSLIKLFKESKNEAAADLLCSYKHPDPKNIGMLEEIYTPGGFIITPFSITVWRRNRPRVFFSAKIGDLSELIPLMRGIAASCAGIKIPCPIQELPPFNSIVLDDYRTNLGEFLLSERDPSQKTLLHFAIDAKSAKKAIELCSY